MEIGSKLLKIWRFIRNPDLYRNFLPNLFRIHKVINQPVIICGAPRSGTTLLMEILDSHPEISMIPFETMLFIERKTRYNGLFKKINKWFIFFQLYATLLSIKIKKGSRMWCEKTPLNVMHVDYINTLFNGRVKFIHIIRDGRDVVLSEHGRLGQFMNAKKWYKYVSNGMRYSHLPNMLVIRYEDVILNFQDSSTRIKKFLSLDMEFREDFYLTSGLGKKKNRSFFSSQQVPKGKGGLLGPLNRNRIGVWRSRELDKKIVEFKKNNDAMELIRLLKYDE